MNPTAHPIPGVQKIAVLRANGLGDFIFTLPALKALRSAYPQSEIVLLAKEWHRLFLLNRPGPVDRVIPVPRSLGVNEASDWEPENPREDEDRSEFFEQIRAENFDLALQMHGGGRNSNPFLLNLGARITAGLRTPDALDLDFTVPYVYFQHEVLRMLEVVSLVGAPLVAIEPSLHVTDADRAEADELLEIDGQPLVVLQPGAGDGRRRWSTEKFAAVGEALTGEGMRVVVTGSAADRELVDRLLASTSAPLVNLCGRLSLGGLTGLLAQSDLFIGNNSGPLHLAQAVGASTVGIFWCGNLINAGPASRSRHRPLLSWTLDCPVCGVNTMDGKCDHSASFVDSISVEDVLSEARSLLGRQERAWA